MTTTKGTPSKPGADLNQNEGEGSRTAGRDYDEAATKYAKSGQVDKAATAAETFVEQNPDEAAQAEAAAKRGPGGKDKKS